MMIFDLNVWGMILQAVGLSLAAVRDLTKHRAEIHDGKVRVTVLAEVFKSAVNDVVYEESTQEKVARKMADIASKFDGFLPYSISIAVVGTVMQIAAEFAK